MQIRKKPQKILFVITKSNWGGAQKYVYDLATSLHERGFESCVAVGGNGELAKRLRDASIPVIHVHSLENDMSILKSISVLFELIRIFRREKPNVIHLNSSKIGLFGSVASLFSRARIIFTAHGWPFNEERGELQKMALRFLMNLTVFLSDETICVSKSTVQTLNPPVWLKKKCTIVYNGIKQTPFKESDLFFTERSLEKSDSIKIVSVGELHESKGFDLAIKAFSHLKDLHWEWHILGEGKERPNLELLIRESGLEGRVFLHGHIQEASTYLKSFDLFFLPSRTESLGYVAIEALQTNLPIIASDAGGIPEVLRRDPGTTFISIRKPNVNKDIEKALRLKSLPVSDEARETLRTQFSLAHMVDRTIATYLL